MGRIAGVVCFWFMAAYLAGASFYSVCSELFGDGLRLRSELGEAECADGLGALSDALYESASESLRAGVRSDALGWTHEWDHRHTTLRGRCAAMQSEYSALKALRLDVSAMLRKHQRDQAGARRSLERALHAIAPTS